MCIRDSVKNIASVYSRHTLRHRVWVKHLPVLLLPVNCRGIAVGGTLHVGYSRLQQASLTFTAALTKRGRAGVEKRKTLLYSSSRGSMVCDSTASEMAVAWPPVDARGGVYSMDASLQWMREGSAVHRNVHV